MKKFWNWIHDDSGGRVLRLEGPIPGRSGPGISGEGLLHAKAVIRILGQFTLSITGFENELRQGNRSQDTALFLISSKQDADLLDRITLRQIFQGCRLQAGRLSRCFCCSTAAKLGCHLRGQITHPRKHPVPRTGFIGKPPVDR